MDELTTAQQAELRFLRSEVDKAEYEAARLDPHMDVQQDLWRARKRLKAYVNELRQQGKRI